MRGATGRQGTAPQVALLFVCLFIVMSPSGLAQEQSPGIFAPVQVVVDAVPGVLTSALAESARDGTPDAAIRQVGRMNGFVAGFSEEVAWPASSDAAAVPLAEALRYARDVAVLTGAVPGAVATVARIDAACTSWFDNATKRDVERWIPQVRRAELRIEAVALGYDALAGRAPVGVDVAALSGTADHLRDALDDGIGTTNVCLRDLAIAVDARGFEDELYLAVVPGRTWPLGSMFLIGGTGATGGGAVDLSSAALGLNTTVSLSSRGGFQFPLEVPRSTPLGTHSIRATFGALNATTSLEVERMTSRLVVTHPESVMAGEDVLFEVRLLAPVPREVARAEVVFDGGFAAVLVLERGTGRLVRQAPDDAGSGNGTVRYAGNDIVAPSAASYEVMFLLPAVAATQAPPPPPPLRVVGSPFEWFWATPVWVYVILVAIVVLVMGDLASSALSRRSADPVLGVLGAVARPTLAPGYSRPRGRPRLPRTMTRLFAAFHAWAIETGMVGPSHTARDLATRLGGSPRMRPYVHEFERVRYGGGRETPRRTVMVGRWVVAQWARLLRRRAPQ